MGKANEQKKLSGSEIHNRNCYLYLCELVAHWPDDLTEVEIEQSRYKPETYNGDIAYADDYNRILSSLENNVNSLNPEKHKAFISALFLNRNAALNETYNHIEPFVKKQNPQATKPLKNQLSGTLSKREGKRFKSPRPQDTESTLERFLRSFFRPHVKTLLETNIPTARNEKEIRMGGPQWHDSKARVSPLFTIWLKTHYQKDEGKRHIYFNNLKRDSHTHDLERNNEATLTKELEKLEAKYNIAVITLPADNPLMNHHAYKDTVRFYPKQRMYDKFLGIAMENDNAQEELRDFYISPEIRKQIFGENQETKLRELLDNSFKKTGLDKTAMLSASGRQAVWFHFIKYELTNHIIDSLNPDTYNFTCKDGIDRGGVASAYYNLMHAIENKKDFSRDEFEKNLHAAPFVVKGRGMNDHIHMIWNTVDAYVNANHKQLQDSQHEWLIYWRDMNCPHARVEALLKKRTDDFIQRLESAQKHDKENPLIEPALEIAKEIKKLQSSSGQRLMLEALSRTEELFSSKTPDPQTLLQFEELIKKTNQPRSYLKIIGGKLEEFFGLLLYVFSDGLLEKGIKTTNTGLYGKQELHEKISKFKTQLQTPTTETAIEKKEEQNPSPNV